MTLHSLAQTWLTEAELLDGYGASEAASAARRHAHELTEAIRTEESEELSISEAAAASGFSARRLRELLADGSIPNAGEKGRPRVRRRDLPRKRRASTPSANGFDASTHAAEILR